MKLPIDLMTLLRRCTKTFARVCAKISNKDTHIAIQNANVNYLKTKNCFWNITMKYRYVLYVFLHKMYQISQMYLNHKNVLDCGSSLKNFWRWKGQDKTNLSSYRKNKIPLSEIIAAALKFSLLMCTCHRCLLLWPDGDY